MGGRALLRWPRGPRTGARRYVLLLAFVAELAGLATILLSMLTSQLLEPAVVDARFDSRRVAGKPPFVVAVSPLATPWRSLAAWQPLAKLLSAKLDQDVRFIERHSCEDAQELIEQGEVGVALVCGECYVHLRRHGRATLLAVPRAHGTTTTRSLLIAGASSPAKKLEDLRGARLALAGPISSTGCLYPRWRVHGLGTSLAALFPRRVYTGAHERSILAVADGILDAAAVDELALEELRARDPAVAARVRVVEASPPFGRDPFVAASQLGPDLLARTRAALLALGKEPASKGALEGLGIEGFEPGDPQAYGLVESMLDVVER